MKFAKGKHAVGICNRCSAKDLLRRLVDDGQIPGLKVHPHCRDIKHEQEKRQIEEDAVILKRPAPNTEDDSATTTSGTLVSARGDAGPFFGGGT